MAKRAQHTAPAPSGTLSGAQKWFTGGVTMVAACMALLVNAKNLGLSEWAGFVSLSVADHAAHRLAISPRVDTLFAVGEPAPLTATVTDAHGAVVSGARIRWQSSDSTIVTVDSTGMLVAIAPGRVTIEARVRDVVTGASVLVHQVPEFIRIAGDSGLRVADGDTLVLDAAALDARGHLVREAVPHWRVADPSVASVDSAGVLHTKSTGRTVLWASLGDLRDSATLDIALTPAAIAVESGADQRALAGRALTSPIVLRVVTRAGAPVPATRVEFTTEDAVGEITPATATTDAAGRVRATWKLGASAGRQRAFARVAVIDSALELHAEADPAPGNARVEVVAHDSSGAVLQRLGQPVRVRLTDSTGVALTAVRVAWSTLDGGSVAGAERTDSLGIAEAQWTLGPGAIAQRLVVQVGNPRFTPATTTRAIGIAGPATALEVTRGDRQRAVAGKPAAKSVDVMVRDSLGNPVANATIRATLTSGSLLDSVLMTDSTGIAKARWTLGTKPGEQKITFAVAGTKMRATATATATVGPAATIALKVYAPRAGAQRVEAMASDEYGNVVNGSMLQFAASSGTLSASQARTDLRGIAAVSWALPSPLRADARISVRINGTRISAAQLLPAALPARPVSATSKTPAAATRAPRRP